MAHRVFFRNGICVELLRFGKATQAGFVFDRDFKPETDGEDVCPPAGDKTVVKPDDNGDGVGPLRSTARASAWKEAHEKGGW